jgi:hypothetical protein
VFFSNYYGQKKTRELCEAGHEESEGAAARDVFEG